ncbi:transposase [Alcaligenaceae bacterium CGII-47]|nr:transposase [Alcaligenaceae bacterium CGII-47]
MEEDIKPGASIAGVALSHGINPNIVHKWRMNVRRGELVVPDTQGFIPVNVQAQPVVRGEQMASPWTCVLAWIRHSLGWYACSVPHILTMPTRLISR